MRFRPQKKLDKKITFECSSVTDRLTERCQGYEQSNQRIYKNQEIISQIFIYFFLKFSPIIRLNMLPLVHIYQVRYLCIDLNFPQESFQAQILNPS